MRDGRQPAAVSSPLETQPSIGTAQRRRATDRDAPIEVAPVLRFEGVLAGHAPFLALGNDVKCFPLVALGINEASQRHSDPLPSKLFTDLWVPLRMVGASG